MMVHEIKRIAENLRQFMTLKKISVREASKRSGFATGTISEITNGKDKRISYYFILAKSIKMPVTSLLETVYPFEDKQLFEDISKLTPSQKLLISQLIKTII